jgi:hypothetical protein
LWKYLLIHDKRTVNTKWATIDKTSPTYLSLSVSHSVFSEIINVTCKYYKANWCCRLYFNLSDSTFGKRSWEQDIQNLLVYFKALRFMCCLSFCSSFACFTFVCDSVLFFISPSDLDSYNFYLIVLEERQFIFNCTGGVTIFI